MEASIHSDTACAAPIPRVLPHSIEAEQQIIGSLLLDNEVWIEIFDLISAEDFFQESHRCIFRHIIKLLESGVAADVGSVLDSLLRSRENGEAGGLPYLDELVRNTPSTRHIRSCVDIVRDNAVRRSVIGVCDVVTGLALKPGHDTKQLIDEAQAHIFALSEGGAKYIPTPIETLSGALGQVVERGRERSDRNHIATGFIDLDNLTSGLKRGDLITIAGFSGVGKTALAMNIAANVGVDLGLPVLIFSLELSVHQLALRFLASKAQVDLAKLKSSTLNDDEWGKVHLELDQLRSVKVFINHTGFNNPVLLRACARRVNRRCKGLGLIVIDGIQMIGSPQLSGNYADKLCLISQMLKALAKELDVPVIVLAQLPRKLGEESEQLPAMSDLRELGALDQVADLVMLVHRDEHDLKKETMNKAITEVRISKNCNGPTGEFSLVFSKSHCRFENMERGERSMSSRKVLF